MRHLVLLILTFILAFTSCKGKYETSDENVDLYAADLTSPNFKGNAKTPTQEYYPIGSENHPVIGAFPFPSDWSLGDDADFSIFVKNPSGVKIFKIQSYYFRDYRSSKLNKEHKIFGNAAAFKTIETLIKKDFIPFADSLNIRLTHQYEIPELAELYRKNASLNFSLNKPKEVTFKVIATEWLNKESIKSIVVIVHHSKIYVHETIWGYTLHTMEVPEVHFEAAKDIFLYSLKNYKTCYQHIYEENKKAYLYLRNDNSCRYFTMKERQERFNAISDEKYRTGMYSKNFDEYLDFLKSKEFITDMDPQDICNLGVFYKKEEATKRYTDSLYTSYSSPYDPSENNDYEGWTQISD